MINGDLSQLRPSKFKQKLNYKLCLFSDPDVTGNDGIYSRYLTDFDLGEGRYEMTVFVDDNAGRAFSFQKERSKTLIISKTLTI